MCVCAVISNTLLSRRGSPAATKKLFNEDKGESNRAKLNRLSATRLTTGKLNLNDCRDIIYLTFTLVLLQREC